MTHGVAWRRTACGSAVAMLASLAAVGVAAEPAPPSFTRDVKPILSNRCIRCHGPDAADRQGGGVEGLRLDTFAGATADLGGHAAIVPDRPEESELLARITADDPDLAMPPPDAGEPLSAVEVDVLRRWIAAGAPYEPHWAYVPPRRPDVPAVRDAAWPNNDVDRFILARLEAEGLAPRREPAAAPRPRRPAGPGQGNPGDRSWFQRRGQVGGGPQTAMTTHRRPSGRILRVIDGSSPGTVVCTCRWPSWPSGSRPVHGRSRSG